MRTLSAPAILLGCLCIGLIVGGLRDPLLWTAASGLIWLVAFASEPPSAPSIKHWGLWISWALISMLACDQPLKSLYSFSSWLTVLVFFFTAAQTWEENDSKRWLFYLAPCVLILEIATLTVKGTVHPMTGLMPPYYNYTVFVEAAFAAAVMGATSHRGFPRGAARWALWGIAVLAMILIFKARSRSGMVAVAAAAAFLIYARGKIKWLAWGCIAAAAILIVNPGNLAGYLLKLDFAAWFKRPQIWASAVRIAADHPFLGEGIGNFEQGFLRHNFPSQWAVNYGFFSNHAHNEFLELAAVTGWIGLILFAAALYRSFRAAYHTSASPWQEAGLYGFIAMTTQCLVDNMLHMPALAMLFFTSLICMGTPEARPLPSGSGKNGRLWRCFCAAGFILSISSFFPQKLVSGSLELYETGQDRPQAAAGLYRAVSIYPADPTLRESLARALLEGPHPTPDAAAEQLVIASRLNPTNALTPMMQAELALRRRDTAAALGFANRSIELEPNFLNARLLRAAIWSREGNKKAARRELDEIRRRHTLINAAPLFSGYDKNVAFFDETRFTSVAAQASYR